MHKLYLFLLLSFLCVCLNPVSGEKDCSAYSTGGYDSCGQDCGACFNPSGRAGVMCPDSGSKGYYCKDEYNFACLDWAFGSKAMQKAENAFNQQHGDNVYFGSGTYGSTEPMRGIGACFRMAVDGLDRDLIVQSVNTGSDVAGNQFDLTQGDGGTGAFNWCAGNDFSMYPGDNSQWGAVYGGWPTVDGCDKLPEYPKRRNSSADCDNLQDLCKYAFAKKVRGPNGENPTIVDLARVECPPALAELHQLRRSDDPSGFSFDAGIRPAGFPNHSVKCGQSGNSFCLTRMQDCRKPSGAFKDNIHEDKVVDGYKIVQVCTNDGYTRLDNKCGCLGCYC